MPGQMGLEKTPEEYVAKMVRVFSEVRRILKKDGTLWLNLGDSYCGSCSGGIEDNKAAAKGTGLTTLKQDRPGKVINGLKPKDLVGIPWRVVFALRADGWYLRSDIIWSKPNPMPESVTDRPTKSHEYIFLMSKSPFYFYNAEAIREKRVTFENRPDGCDRHRTFGYDSKYKTMEGSKQNLKIPSGWDTGPGAHGTIHRDGRTKPDKQRGHSRRHAGFNDRWDHMNIQEQSENRNKRSVWEIATFPYPESHFATFPEKLVEPCILAGSSQGDIVLDPFMGSGTVGVVAKRFKRQWLGIEINPKYIEMADRRINAEQEPILVES
jgi:DNA modification methylase